MVSSASSKLTVANVWVVVVKVGLAAVFVWAAVAKLRDLNAFVSDINNYHLLPANWASYAAIAVPAFELAVALALVTGVAMRGAALVAVGMLVAFTFAITQAILRGINVDCGCFGAATQARTDWSSVVRNGVLIMAAVSIVKYGDRSRDTHAS